MISTITNHSVADLHSNMELLLPTDTGIINAIKNRFTFQYGATSTQQQD